MSAPALQVDRLQVEVGAPGGGRLAVRGVSFRLDPGERVALVGESGCGKSLTARAVLGVLDSGSERVLPGGEVQLPARAADSAPSRVRGGVVGMVFQDPVGSLNPVLTVGHQVAEVVRAHRGLGRAQARDAARGHLAEVELDPAAIFHRYPHQLSGGMAQRVALAAALAGEPDVLIADEPTTALDAGSQRTILALLRSIQAERGMALLLITHDLLLAAGFAERILVMYGGCVVEEGPSSQLLASPGHPYTRALLATIPTGPGSPLPAGIPGSVPSPGAQVQECLFAPRCPLASPECFDASPVLRSLAGADEPSRVACHHPIGGGSQE